jgi:hypothetical protein
MTCQRCGVEAELGECPGPCGRDLCLECYDGDQEAGSCRTFPQELRNQLIRELRLAGKSPQAIAEKFSLSYRRVCAIIE